jgi:hypothetical protein
MPNQPAPYFFISYARADGEKFARQIYNDLNVSGYHAWLDKVNIADGSDWDAEIDRGLAQAQAILVVLTPGSVVSLQVKSEWNSGIERQLPVIPLLVQDCDIPRVLKMINHIDFRLSYDQGFTRLLERLQTLQQDHLSSLQEKLSELQAARSTAKNPDSFTSKIEALTKAIQSWQENGAIPPEAVALPKRRLSRRAFILRIAAAVAALGLLSGAVWALFLRPTGPPVMGGDFNIAIAEFVVVDENNQPVTGEDGMEVAGFIHERLSNSFSELDLASVQVQIYGPETTGKLSGSSSEKQAETAALLADKINAHLVIYGTINLSDRTTLTPEFYVNYQGFEQALEITGQHALGSPMFITIPFNTNQIQFVENPALSARINALSTITIGLAYLSIDNPDKALEFFSGAEKEEGWLDNAGKEIVYLLIGNANAIQASMMKDDNYLDPAYQAYSRALQVNPDYARAMLGQAGILYLEALGDPQALSLNAVDLDKLQASEIAFQQALQNGSAPPTANVETKMHFGLGQIYFVRAQLEGGDWLERSRQEFLLVTADYESGNQLVVLQTSHAYARLGLIARLEDQLDQAVQYYQQSIAIASPFYQAYYNTRLGETYLSADLKEEALETYQEAIRVAEFYGDQESVNTYQNRLLEIQ